MKPVESFDAWLARTRQTCFATADDEATFIGATLIGALAMHPMSAREQAQLHALGLRVDRRRELWDAYERTVKRKAVRVKLDPTKEADAAYLRCIEKRAARRG